jgi:hypothetical protein
MPPAAGLLRRARVSAAAVLLAALGGCVGEGSATRGVAEATGLATTPQESKPWVQQTRRAGADYIPVGTVATRAAPRRSVEEFKRIEAGLESRRLRNEAAGNTARSLATTPAPAPAQVDLPR